MRNVRKLLFEHVVFIIPISSSLVTSTQYSRVPTTFLPCTRKTRYCWSFPCTTDGEITDADHRNRELERPDPTVNLSLMTPLPEGSTHSPGFLEPCQNGRRKRWNGILRRQVTSPRHPAGACRAEYEGLRGPVFLLNAPDQLRSVPKIYDRHHGLHRVLGLPDLHRVGKW